MKRIVVIPLLAVPGGAQAQEADDAAARPFCTGSLYAVSPVSSQVGALAVEPYLITSLIAGSYDPHGHHLEPDSATDAAMLLAVVR